MRVNLACLLFFLATGVVAQRVHTATLDLTLATDHGAAITSLTVNGQKVINNPEGISTSLTVNGVTYSSAQASASPSVKRTPGALVVDGIVYGPVRERWVFTTAGDAVRWTIQRTLSHPVSAEQEDAPLFRFDQMSTWDGAYQGYGGVAWFYLFEEKNCTYGVHTTTTNFWNSHTNVGLTVDVDAGGKKVAMRYTRTADDHLAYGITVSANDALPRLDSGTHRRRFIRGSDRVWAPMTAETGTTTVTLRYYNVEDRYGRGKFQGIDGARVSAVLSTIARMGVIDSLHFGGNSWHTPYGPICLHEQYIGLLGLAIDDTDYLKGYKSCLDFYRDHAIKPDGRVYPRWAYSDEDMMPGQGNKEGFYEAQWGYLIDSNPDLVTNVSDCYNLTGDKAWVRRHQRSNEKALDWLLHRDDNGNGLVEVMTDSEKQKRGSDWIDIVWASYENAFINAKLYHALVEWAPIEARLGDAGHAATYAEAAARLKASFNKPIGQGGFWDEENGCYVHWLDKDGSAHGRNMVTPVNFMAIAYGLCDEPARQKRILDGIEAGMRKEQLFFWPLVMTSYAPGEAKRSQYPFPSYENGDIFLSWGSIALQAYAAYDPALAVRYVRNVLEQYGKDGLAYQRYGRARQEGEGDDILSGNSLTVVGLYQSIYGIQPVYNRLYLEPHITGELSGTSLLYRFRGDKLTIDLDTGRYAITDRGRQISSQRPFGFYYSHGKLCFFEGNADKPSLEATTGGAITMAIGRWDAHAKEWTASAPAAFSVTGLKAGRTYEVTMDGKNRKMTTDAKGVLHLEGAAKNYTVADQIL